MSAIRKYSIYAQPFCQAYPRGCWPTDLTDNDSFVEIHVPNELKQTLNERTLAKGAAFYPVTLTNTPSEVRLTDMF